MGDKFQEQRFRRRPREGGSRRQPAPGLEICEIRGERPERIFSHAFDGEMFQGFDIVACEKGGQLIAPVDWKDGVKRVEFLGAAEDGLAVGTR